MNHLVHGKCTVLVYVDDILIVSDSLKWNQSAKRAIGETKFILGMDKVRNRAEGTISLS
jgi:hypothetical protein